MDIDTVFYRVKALSDFQKKKNRILCHNIIHDNQKRTFFLNFRYLNLLEEVCHFACKTMTLHRNLETFILEPQMSDFQRMSARNEIVYKI